MNSNANSSQGPINPASPQTPSPQPGLSTESNLFKVSGAQSASPLDFIKNNLRQPVPASQVLTPEAPPTEVKPVEAPSVEEIAPTVEGAEDKKVEAPAPKKGEEPEEFGDEEVGEGQELTPQQQRFKTLRTKYKAEKEASKKALERAAELELELTAYKTGQALPDTLQEKENEIATLRKYEQIVNFKASPEYVDNYVKPLETVSSELETVFTDYGIPKEVLEETEKLGSVAKQNQFLSEHFDPTGAMQVRALLDKKKGLMGNLQAAEKEPMKALERIRMEGEAARLEAEKQSRMVIQSQLRDSWADSIKEIQEQGVFKELIRRPNDTKFNETVVNPLYSSAAAEAGKFISMLVEGGLKTLSPEVAKFISRMSLLAHSSALNAATREAMSKAYAELEENTKRFNSVIRPQIGMNNGAPTPQAPREALTPQTMASKLVSQVQGQRK